jgi:O-antigen/teichoic acid export membrane protein
MATLQPTLRARLVGSSLLSGSALLFLSMTFVNAGNYLVNLVMGRWLGPAAFAELSLIVTLMLMVTLITVTLQTVGARFTAIHAARSSTPHLLALRRWLARWTWAGGLIVSALLALTSPWLASFFHTSSVWPFVLLAAGLPLYFVQGVDRGALQGQTRFGILSLSYQAEMWTRLLASLVFVALGWSVNGAVGGLTLSFVAAWLVGFVVYDWRTRTPDIAISRTEQLDVLRYGAPVSAALVGQILINNSDILIVKHFFVAEQAGLYAALALIGRIVFFATWSVVTTLFPIVAQKHQRGEPHRHLLGVGVGLVGLLSAGIIAATLALPELIVQSLFGAAYLPIAPLLWLYAVATALYALANVIITYHLSLGHSGGSVLAITAGVAQVVGLWFFHATLTQVVLFQIGLMTALLAALLLWDGWHWLAERRSQHRENRSETDA